MDKLPLLLATLAVAAGCSAAPETRIAPRPYFPGWQDTGTPPASVVAVEREIRYYRDETGAIWDDRGRKIEAGS